MKHIFKTFIFSLILPVLPIGAEEPARTEPIVILGGGVGSLTSAIYMGRAGISPLVIEGPMPGGLLTQSHSVQNWPGEYEIMGAELTEKMRSQAEANGARFLTEEVIGVDFAKSPFTITTRALDGSRETRQIFAESCIIAMGTKPNFLNIPGEQEYWGHGVTNCAICDGSLYKNKIVGVVGGGDAAVTEALYLSNIAKEVNLFVRKGALRAMEEKRIETLRQKANVKFFFNTTVEEIKGSEGRVKEVVLNREGEEVQLPLDGLFLAIGSTPNSALFAEQLHLDEKGYIILEKDQQTSIKGVYAIGDIVDPIYKQAISAAGDGAKAALQAQHYLSDLTNHLAKKESVTSPEKVVTAQAAEEAPLEKVAVQSEASPEVIDVSSVEHFQSELSNSELPVVVDFYATWCGPCKKVYPLIESSANQLVGKVKFLKVNVDKVYDLSATYNIQAMPTLLLFDAAGNEVERKVGLEQISDLLQKLQDTD